MWEKSGYKEFIKCGRRLEDWTLSILGMKNKLQYLGFSNEWKKGMRRLFRIYLNKSQVVHTV